ncbi:unnamed protein product, partial [Adineta steineri]
MATGNQSNLCSICKKLSASRFFVLDVKIRPHDELLDIIQRLENPDDLSSDLFDQIDQQRYQQLYQTIVKKYFTNMINEQQALISQNQLFSNLQVTESGMVVANLS